MESLYSLSLLIPLTLFGGILSMFIPQQSIPQPPNIIIKHLNNTMCQPYQISKYFQKQLELRTVKNCVCVKNTVLRILCVQMYLILQNP